MKKIIALATLAVAASALAVASVASAAPAGGSSMHGKNIVQTAVGAKQFTTLVALVKKAGLAGALSGKGPLTVFAPTDAAFAKVPKATLDALAKNPAQLKAVLLYHVVSGKVTAADVVKLTSAKTLQGASAMISVKGGKVFVDKARVVTPDVMASNGVVHVVNGVVVPKLAPATSTSGS